MANRYWVGGTGQWFSSHWATTSGGTGGASWPTASDDVFFDSNSGSGTSSLGLNPISGAFPECRSLNVASPTMNVSGDLIVNGSVDISSSGTGSLNLSMTPSSSSVSLNTHGYNVSRLTVSPKVTATLNQNSDFGTDLGPVDLRSDTSGVSLIYNTNGYDIDSDEWFGVFTVPGGAVTANLSTSTISTKSTSLVVRVSGAGTNMVNGSSATVVSNAPFGSPQFRGGSAAYGVLQFTGTATSYSINGSTTLGTLEVIGTGKTLSVTAGSTVTATNFIINGSSGSLNSLRSLTAGSRYFLRKPSGTASLNYVDVQDSDVGGGATWNAYDSIDSGNNTGWSRLGPLTVSSEAKGTLLFGGSATRNARTYRQATGSMLFGGQAYAIMRRDPSAIESKNYLAKVYAPDGTYLETWGKDIISDPEFTREINSLGATLRLELARNSDTVGQTTGPLTTEAGTTITTEDGFPLLATVESRNQVGDGSSVLHNNRVDLYVFYGSVEPLLTELGEEITTEDGAQILATMGAPNGLRIFSGFIDGIVQRFGSTETTIVELASYGYDLDQFPVTNGAGLTTVTYNSQDPSVIARSLMSQFVTDSAGYGTYTVGTTESIPLTGTSVSYTFKNQTYADALKKTLELMPSNWFFRVGLGDNTVYFGSRQETPHHTFVKGVHFESFELAGKISESTNRVLFVGGGDPALYKDYSETPASRTRRTLEIYSDSRVTTATSAQIISEGIIDRKNLVQNRSTITILQKQYDIESIQLGQMVGFANFGTEVDSLVLQVVGITYNPDYVILQLDALPVTVNKRLEDVKRNLIDTDSQNVPTAPS